MTEEIKKCVKGESCIHCGSTYCRFVDEVNELMQEYDELKFANDRYKQLLKGCPTEDEDCGLCVIDEQNKRLKQENKDLKKQIESDKGLITVGGKQQYDMTMAYDKYKTALEEIREIAELPYYPKGMPEEPLSQRDFILHAINNYEQRRIKILTKINEVLQ